jgi:hypothetical protein
MMSGCNWFTTLDLVSGYWQVEVHPQDKAKTAFTTPEGLFEFNVMPFGLCNGPATFQRLMDAVLAGLQWTTCVVYIDDGKSFTDHLYNISCVLAHLRQANLKLQPTKCVFARKRIPFLGFIISSEGIATDPSKIEKVATWPTPTCRRDVQQFLGFANYYRRFIRNFSDVAKPLHRLTEKVNTFAWSESCQLAFDELRRRLTSAPILAFPDYSKPFLLDTDASDMGIGAVLSQVHSDGLEHVIAYGSRCLSKPERRYCTTRKELLAVVFFTKHFRAYLLGWSFKLRTEHGSLQWLFNFKEPEGQLARWMEQLQEFTFTTIHRQGRKHTNADALSRLPCTQCGRKLHEFDASATCSMVAEDVNDIDESHPSYRAQREDPIISPILAAKEANKRPHPDTTATWSRDSRILLQQWEQLEIHNGLLWRRFYHPDGSHSHLQLIVPKSLRQQVLEQVDGGVVSGHLGQQKTLSQLRNNFYWPSQAYDVKAWCRTCAVCAARKTPTHKHRAGLHTIHSGYPMQVLAVDILGPLPETPSGNKYVLVALYKMV